MTILGFVHVVGATFALLFGAGVLWLRKGSRQHVLSGRVYACSMLALNTAALLLFRQTGQWGPFHVLAVLSLGTLMAGIVPLMLGRRSPADIARHSYFMAWSYVGLVAAGIAQLTNLVLDWNPWLTVAMPSMVVVAIGGAAIHWLVPRTLQSLSVTRHQAVQRRA